MQLVTGTCLKGGMLANLNAAPFGSKKNKLLKQEALESMLAEVDVEYLVQFSERIAWDRGEEYDQDLEVEEILEQWRGSSTTNKDGIYAKALPCNIFIVNHLDHTMSQCVKTDSE